MTVQKYCELLEYVKENNSWNMCESARERNRKIVKYVDASFDSRTGTIWMVNFRSVTGEKDKAFRVDDKYGLASMYEWLEEPLHEECAYE